MRKPTTEHVQVLNHADPFDENAVQEASIADSSPVYAGSAVSEDDAEVARNAPKPVWYRVIVGGPVLENGFRTRIKEGKELNSFNYNIRKLQSQGIKLQQFDPDALPDTEVFS